MVVLTVDKSGSVRQSYPGCACQSSWACWPPARRVSSRGVDPRLRRSGLLRAHSSCARVTAPAIRRPPATPPARRATPSVGYVDPPKLSAERPRTQVRRTPARSISGFRDSSTWGSESTLGCLCQTPVYRRTPVQHRTQAPARTPRRNPPAHPAAPPWAWMRVHSTCFARRSTAEPRPFVIATARDDQARPAPSQLSARLAFVRTGSAGRPRALPARTRMSARAAVARRTAVARGD